SNPANDTSTTHTQVSRDADLAVTKTADPTAIAGTDTTFTISVKDNGPSDNAGYSLSDALPAGTSFVSASPACTESSGTVTCTSSGLAAGDSESFTITVHVSAGYAEGGDLANTASIASNATADSTPGNDSSTSHTTVHTSADLSIHKDGPTDATAGDPAGFDYTLTVTNNGPSD